MEWQWLFDSDILEEEVEILGYPEFEVEFTCDKPNAFMYAQLSDIHPGWSCNKSFLWTYESDALEGHDKVVYLEEGKTYKAKVQLDVT